MVKESEQRPEEWEFVRRGEGFEKLWTAGYRSNKQMRN